MCHEVKDKTAPIQGCLSLSQKHILCVFLKSLDPKFQRFLPHIGDDGTWKRRQRKKDAACPTM